MYCARVGPTVQTNVCDSPLILRPWAVSDAEALRDAIDEDVHHLKPWLSWTIEEPTSLGDTRARLRRWVDEFRRGRAFRYAIVAADRAAVILGGANLYTRAGPAAREIGYWVRKSAARQGVATAAVSALAVHAFENEEVERLIIQCDVGNRTSASFARRLGFAFVGPLTSAYPDGTHRPVDQFELLREDYHRHHAVGYRERARSVRLATESAES